MSNERIALNFDLFQDKLKKAGFSQPLEAYNILSEHLKQLGYEKRQQSSWLSKNPKIMTDIITDITYLRRQVLWLSSCINEFTATSEGAILDLNPYIQGSKTTKEFINFENSKGITQEKRAIHFDLSVHEIDKNYTHRSEPYRQIYKGMKELGFTRQQGSGYISNNELTPDEFIYAVQQLNQKIPTLKSIIKSIDATYLKDIWDMTPYIDPKRKSNIMNVNYINPKAEKIEHDLLQDKILNQKELLLINKRIRYGETNPNLLIGQSFEYQNEIFKIDDLFLIENQQKDVAILQRLSDGQLFQDNDFASSNPLKLILNKPSEKINSKESNISIEKIFNK